MPYNPDVRHISARILLLALTSCTLTLGQQLTGDAEVPREVPLITGAFGFLSDLQRGQQEFGPKFEPILLFPLSKRLLIEAEYSTDLPVPRDGGKLGPAVLDHSVEYMQIDYSVASNFTLVGGYFATPFGIYKERIDPLWVRNLLDEPLLYPINDNSSNGVMARGGVAAAPWLKVNYAVSFSAAVDNSQFSSNKQTSDRVSIYLPNDRLELGASYGRVLQGRQYNLHGFDLTWNGGPLPVDVRGEGLWSGPLGNAYWLEAVYRFPVSAKRLLRHSQAVVRGEQFWAAAGSESVNPDVPQSNTNRVSFGWNYWFSDAVRANVAYAREWDAGAPGNVVTLGLVYRFTIPGERTR